MAEFAIGAHRMQQAVLPQNAVNDAAPAGNAGAPAALNPADVLARSRELFPFTSEKVLTSKFGFSGVSEKALTMMYGIRDRLQKNRFGISVGAPGQNRVAFMPTAGVRGNDEAAIMAKVQTMVLAGAELFKQIQAETAPPPSKEGMTNLMWYMQALASSKAMISADCAGNGYFAEGSLSVEDPEGRLEAYLTSANSYDRSSSHLKEYQALGNDFRPHGVDVRGTETPNERKTILFARLPTDAEAANAETPGLKGTGDKRMLFIKMEPNGCRGLSFKGGVTPREPRSLLNIGQGIKRFFANIKDTLQHGMGFTRTLMQKAGLVGFEIQNNRERIPPDVKDLWARGRMFFDTALTRSAGNPAVTAALLEADNLLSANNPLGDSGGIKTMIANIDQAVHRLEQADAAAGTEVLRRQLFSLGSILGAHGDHADIRIGNEVILTADEMDAGSAERLSSWESWDGTTPLHNAGEISREAQDVILAGMQYVIANIDSEDRLDSFMKDMNRTVCSFSRGDGETVAVDRNPEAARARTLELADGNEAVAKMLMTFANQSLASDLVDLMDKESVIASNMHVFPGNAGSYSLARQPDAADGAQRYVIEFLIDGESSLPMELSKADDSGSYKVNTEASYMRFSTKLGLSFAPDGTVTPDFPEAPNYEYSFTAMPD